MSVYLLVKFQVSSITPTSFRQEDNFTLPQPQNKPLKSPPRLGLTHNFDVNYIFDAKKTLVDETDATYPKHAPEIKVWIVRRTYGLNI